MGQELYKKSYTIKEFYTILYKGLRTLKYLIKNKREKKMSNHFIERIMLAVTEVNGCEICSYGHTKIALEQGMDASEIEMLLSGTTESVPKDELKAIMFAQHYADTKGHPTKESWEKIVETYGEERALGILGAIRMIMIGNSYGIALSAFKSRMKGQPIEKSSFLYEISLIISLIPLLPISLIHVLILKIVNRPIIQF